MSDPEVLAAVIAGVVAVVVEVIRRGKQANARLDATNTQIAAVLHEMQPNSGKSLYDRICRMDNTLEAVRKVQASQGERLAAVEARVTPDGPARDRRFQ